MPLCCLLMAHFPRTRLCFGVPVLSLVVGGALAAFVVGGRSHGVVLPASAKVFPVPDVISANQQNVKGNSL
jgi:hypothetical protein